MQPIYILLTQKYFAGVMVIDSIIIEGISNIEHIRLDIGEINALIAPNGYGKSNVLSAISFGMALLNANEDTKSLKGVTRYSSKLLAKLRNVKRMDIDEFIRIGVKSSIEDWILDDLKGICSFLCLKKVPSSLKGTNGYQKMLDLYNKARRTYKKGLRVVLR